MSRSVGSLALALNAEAADAPRQQWVHMLPAPGVVRGRDGRTWRLGDLAELIRATNTKIGHDLPVDYEHQTEHATTNGQPAPAAGWMKELQSRADGLWARVEWTAKAAAHLADKEYRFISSVFVYTQAENTIRYLVSAGLTNVPNLTLKALARAENGDTMDEMTELRGLLALDAGAGLPEVVTSVRSLVELRQAANRPDPSKFVPMELFQQTVRELNSRCQGMTEDMAEAHVQDQISRAKMLPFLKDWGVALCTRDRPLFDSFIANTGPSIQNIFRPLNLDRIPPAARAPRMSDEEAQIARSLGHSEDEVLAANKDRAR